MSSRYFKFPLSILRDGKDPAESMNMALASGVYNAAIGYLKVRTSEEVRNLTHITHEEFLSLDGEYEDDDDYDEFEKFVMGSKICDVDADSFDWIRYSLNLLPKISTTVPFVTMKADYFWSAYHQILPDQDDLSGSAKRGFSWKEFRVLAAILSAKTNRYGFAFLGWESISVRASGFFSKSSPRLTTNLPPHASPLSRKQIRSTCDRLEQLKCFTRFRHAKGPRGGLMAYSVRHDREGLAAAVAKWDRFNRNASVRENRASDLRKSLEGHQS